MKYELLKRTAIALFVGGVISTYASADGQLDAAFGTIKTAIETNKTALESKADKALVDELDEDVGKLEDKVNGIAETAANKEDLGKLNDAVETLRDDVNNNTDILSQNSEDIAANKEAIEANKTAIETNKTALESKADKALVDELDEDVGKLEDKVNGIAETAANKEDLGKLNDAVETLRDDVNNNTDILSQNSEDIAANKEAIEANKTAIETNKAAIDEIKNLQGYDSLTKVENIVSNKADQDYVEGLERDVKANTQDIKELSEGIRDNILPAIEANRTDIDANKADVDTLKNKVAGAAAAVDLLTQNIALNKTNIESKADQDYVEGLERDVKANTQDIKELSEGIRDNILPAIEANRTDIDANKADVDTLKNRADGAAAAVNLLAQNIGLNKTNIEKKADKADVDALKNRVDGAAAAANLLAQNIGLNKTNIEKKADKTDVDANKAAIGDLATVIDEAVTNLDGVVNDLHGDLSVTKHTVAENRKDIDKNASRITNTRNKQVLQNARLDNHSNRIGVNEAAIATNKADIETNKADIETNKADIATNKADIATNKADIATNKANIITNRANIAANTAAIATHNQRLDHLDNRVNKLDKDLKRGLATQAALTGLFQPYTVGKANFTAAVGGYKSQTAVAIGTGYRYNKHVATKAGIAFTQGGAAYNVGVNFEW